MRPYVKRHAFFLNADGYPRREEAAPQSIGGTIAALSTSQRKRLVERLAKRSTHSEPILHITLSAPEGLRLSAVEWRRAIDAVFRTFGIPGETVPWAGWRHGNTAQDHVHLYVLRVTFVGRVLEIEPTDRLCNAAHRAVCHALYLPQPEYEELGDPVRAIPLIPARRRTGIRAKAAAALEQAFSSLPTDKDALSDLSLIHI